MATRKTTSTPASADTIRAITMPAPSTLETAICKTPQMTPHKTSPSDNAGPQMQTNTMVVNDGAQQQQHQPCADDPLPSVDQCRAILEHCLWREARLHASSCRHDDNRTCDSSPPLHEHPYASEYRQEMISWLFRDLRSLYDLSMDCVEQTMRCIDRFHNLATRNQRNQRYSQLRVYHQMIVIACIYICQKLSHSKHALHSSNDMIRILLQQEHASSASAAMSFPSSIFNSANLERMELTICEVLEWRLMHPSTTMSISYHLIQCFITTNTKENDDATADAEKVARQRDCQVLMAVVERQFELYHGHESAVQHSYHRPSQLANAAVCNAFRLLSLKDRESSDAITSSAADCPIAKRLWVMLLEDDGDMLACYDSTQIAMAVTANGDIIGQEKGDAKTSPTCVVQTATSTVRASAQRVSSKAAAILL